LIEDHYAILGLEEKTYESNVLEISKAYKNMALIFHPDKIASKRELTQNDKD